MYDLIWQDGIEQAKAVRDRKISAVELLNAYLDRIERFNTDLRAVVALDEALARKAAQRVDKLIGGGDAVPAFAGLPMLIKDTDDVAGLPTTESCEVLSNNIAAADSPIVERFRASGAIMFGKSNVPEFCSSLTNSRLNGICRNPWDRTRTVGGSSGGAAGALAAGLCAVSHGTDGAGSVRVPASWCGLVGLKPSRGLVSFGPEIDHPIYNNVVHGVLVRSVRDAAAMLDVMAPAGSWTPSPAQGFAAIAQKRPRALRVAISTRFPAGTIETDVADTVKSAGELTQSLGHEVVEADPQWETILRAGALPLAIPHIARHVPLDQVHRLEPRNRPGLLQEGTMTVLELYKLIAAVRDASELFLRFWDDIDVLITPTVGIVAPDVDWAPWDQSRDEHRKAFGNLANFAHPFNLTGQPAISLPLGWSRERMPIGVQLVANRLGEATLLQLAGQIEEAAPWLEQITVAGRRL